jgi:hypothetical protein
MIEGGFNALARIHDGIRWFEKKDLIGRTVAFFVIAKRDREFYWILFSAPCQVSPGERL